MIAGHLGLGLQPSFALIVAVWRATLRRDRGSPAPFREPVGATERAPPRQVLCSFVDCSNGNNVDLFYEFLLTAFPGGSTFNGNRLPYRNGSLLPYRAG
jgi:hypothetical protein